MAESNSSFFNMTTQGHSGSFNLTTQGESSIQFNSTATIPNVTKPVDNWPLVREDPAYKIALSVNFYSYRTIIALGTLLNAIVFVTMLSSHKLRHNSSGILIILLAVLEFVDCLLRFLNHFLVFGLCQAHEFVIAFMIFVGNNLILLIAINRFALVCFPFKHHPVTSIKSTLIQIAVLAVTGLGANSFLFAVDFLHHVRYGCRIVLSTFDLYFKGALSVYICLGSFFPALGTMVLSIIVIIRLRNRGSLKDTSSQQGKTHQAERNITKAMIGVGLGFVICNLPYWIFWLTYFYTPKRHDVRLWALFETLYMYLGVFFNMNRINNFFLYLVYHTRFRVRLLQLIKCKWRAGNED